MPKYFLRKKNPENKMFPWPILMRQVVFLPLFFSQAVA
jgi:hypothetical protein